MNFKCSAHFNSPFEKFWKFHKDLKDHVLPHYKWAFIVLGDSFWESEAEFFYRSLVICKINLLLISEFDPEIIKRFQMWPAPQKVNFRWMFDHQNEVDKDEISIRLARTWLYMLTKQLNEIASKDHMYKFYIQYIRY